MNPVYATAVGASVVAFKLLRWHVRIIGGEHVPSAGGAVVATNHLSYFDFIFSGYGVRQANRRRVRFVAKREVFDHPVTGPLMRAMRHIPVDRAGDTRIALRAVGQALDEGDLVGMFPEGTINLSFVPGRGHPGAAKMAVDAKVPLIPGAIWGSQRIFTRGRRLRAAPGTAVLVSFGPPIEYEPDERPLAVHGRLMDAIRQQLQVLQHRYPQRPANRLDGWWQPIHLGGSAPTPEAAEALAKEEAAKRREERREQRRQSR